MRYLEFVTETASSGSTSAGGVASGVCPLFKKKLVRRIKEAGAGNAKKRPTTDNMRKIDHMYK
jgi:hypothetical protein